VARRFWADQSGATAIEYGLIAAGIALAIIAVLNGLGTKLNTKLRGTLARAPAGNNRYLNRPAKH